MNERAGYWALAFVVFLFICLELQEELYAHVYYRYVKRFYRREQELASRRRHLSYLRNATDFNHRWNVLHATQMQAR